MGTSLEIRSSLNRRFDVFKVRPSDISSLELFTFGFQHARAHIQVLLSAEIQLLLPSFPLSAKGRHARSVRRYRTSNGDYRVVKIHRGERGSVTPALQKTDTKARPCSLLFSSFAYISFLFLLINDFSVPVHVSSLFSAFPSSLAKRAW